MTDWSEVNAWRKEQRARIRAARQALPPAQRRELHERILGHLRAGFPELAAATVGCYWPMRGEVDVLPLLTAHVAAGGRAALPVVVTRNAPVEWWAWTPKAPMEPGIWKIPVPAERRVLPPSVLVVPLLGFDGACYRLGNGGGYYDRTLAELAPRPLTLGVGYELGRLDSIHPQPHDLPLDACITEDGWRWPEASDPATAPSSPVCYAAEADPAYFGYLDEADTRALLAQMREDAAIALSLATVRDAVAPDAEPQAATRAAAARGCARLCGLLARAGAPPPPAPAPTMPADEGAPQRIAGELAARLEGLAELVETALPRIGGEARHALLTELLAQVRATVAHLKAPADQAG